MMENRKTITGETKASLFSKLHPLTKILFLMSFTVVFILQKPISILVIFAAFLVLIVISKYNPLKNWKTAIFLFILLSVTFLYTLIISQLSFKDSLEFSFIIVLKWTVIIYTAYIYSKCITTSELIYLSRRISKKPSTSIPLIVAFRVLPLAVEEASKISFALKARGIKPVISNPYKIVLYFKYFSFAYLATFIDFLLDISVIFELKGIRSVYKSNYRKYNYSFIDVVLIIYSLPIIIFTLVYLIGILFGYKLFFMIF